MGRHFRIFIDQKSLQNVLNQTIQTLSQPLNCSAMTMKPLQISFYECIVVYKSVLMFEKIIAKKWTEPKAEMKSAVVDYEVNHFIFGWWYSKSKFDIIKLGETFNPYTMLIQNNQTSKFLLESHSTWESSSLTLFIVHPNM